MKHFRLLLIIPVFLICFLCTACSDLHMGVQGLVIDIINGVPVDGAIVKITNKAASKKTYYTITLNGYFDINVHQSLTEDEELDFYIVKGGCLPLDETSSAKDTVVFFMICE